MNDNLTQSLKMPRIQLSAKVKKEEKHIKMQI